MIGWLVAAGLLARAAAGLSAEPPRARVVAGLPTEPATAGSEEFFEKRIRPVLAGVCFQPAPPPAVKDDQPIAGLLKDLKSHGLFDEVLVVWTTYLHDGAPEV